MFQEKVRPVYVSIPVSLLLRLEIDACEVCAESQPFVYVDTSSKFRYSHAFWGDISMFWVLMDVFRHVWFCFSGLAAKLLPRLTINGVDSSEHKTSTPEYIVPGVESKCNHLFHV